MIKAQLEYTDCLGDKNIVYEHLMHSDVTVVKQTGSYSNKKVIVLARTNKELKELVSILSKKTKYGVSILRARKAVELFGFWI